MTILVEAIFFSLIGITIFLVSTVIGSFFFNQRYYEGRGQILLNSFLGLFTIIAVYSFYYVGIKTINLFSFLIIIYLFWQNPKKFKLTKFDFRNIMPLVYIFPIVFVIAAFYKLPDSIENDVRYYAKIGSCLTRYKVENRFHFYNEFDPNFRGTMPYHYFELWFTSLIVKFSGIKSLIALKYIVYPFFISSLTFGIISIVNKRPFFTIIFFLALSFIPLHLLSFNKTGFPNYSSIWLRPNFTVYCYVLICLFLQLKANDFRNFFLFALIGATVSVTIMPVLFAGIMLFTLLQYKQKQLTTRLLFFYNSIEVIFIALIAFFFLFFSANINMLEAPSIFTSIFDGLRLWKAMIGYVFYTSLELFSISVLIYCANKYLLKLFYIYNILFLVCILLLVGIIGFQLTNQVGNSYQFPYIAFCSLSLLLIITVIHLIYTLFQRAIKILVALFFGVYFLQIIYNSPNFNQSLKERNLPDGVSRMWAKKVSNYLEMYPEKNGGFFVSTKELKDFPPAHRNCITFQPMSFLAYYTEHCNFPDLTSIDTLLSDFKIGKEKDYEIMLSWKKVFPRFANEANPVNFLKDNRLDFIICDSSNTHLFSKDWPIFRDTKTKFILITKNKIP